VDFIKTVTDAFNSLAQNFNDRIRSPIGGAFFFSWLVFNWQFVYYFIVQVDTAENKIKHITYSYIDIKYLLCYPAAAAVAYILLFPVISNVSTLVWTVIDKWLKTFNAKIIENKVPISKEEQEVLYGLMHDQNKKHKKEKDKLQDQINALNAVFNDIAPEAVDEKNRDGILAEVPSEDESESQDLDKRAKETEALNLYSGNSEIAKALKETKDLKEKSDNRKLARSKEAMDSSVQIDNDKGLTLPEALKKAEEVSGEQNNSALSNALKEAEKTIAEHDNSALSKAFNEIDETLAKQDKSTANALEKLDKTLSAPSDKAKATANSRFKKYNFKVTVSDKIKRESFIRNDKVIKDQTFYFNREDISPEIFSLLAHEYFNPKVNSLSIDYLTLPKYQRINKTIKRVTWVLVEEGLLNLSAKEILKLWFEEFNSSMEEVNLQRGLPF
jgi:hypothetical protein